MISCIFLVKHKMVTLQNSWNNLYNLKRRGVAASSKHARLRIGLSIRLCSCCRLHFIASSCFSGPLEERKRKPQPLFLLSLALPLYYICMQTVCIVAAHPSWVNGHLPLGKSAHPPCICNNVHMAGMSVKQKEVIN